MDSTSYWTEPRPPRERFDSVFALWARAGALFFEGFDFVFGVMLIVGLPASAANLAVEIAIAPLIDQGVGSLLSVLIDSAVSSVFSAWLSGPLYYAVAMRAETGTWPGLFVSLRWTGRRWGRMTAVLWISTILFIFGLVAFVLPGLYLLVKLWLAEAVVVFEPGQPAFLRSWRLSRQAPINIFLAIGPFLLAVMLFTFGGDLDALQKTPLLAIAFEWSQMLLLSAFPAVVTALLYGWLRSEEDAAAITRLES